MGKSKSACGLVRQAATNPSCWGGQQGHAAVQIAKVIDRIPHSKYVEQMVGVGGVYRRVTSTAKHVLNDKDCKRISVLRKRTCSPPAANGACERLKAARVTCGRDWKAVVRAHDGKDVLTYLDPPYEYSKDGKRNVDLRYKHQTIPLEEVVRVARGLRGKVLISYSNTPATRQALCRQPFRCKKIQKWALQGKPYTELLAVKR